MSGIIDSTRVEWKNWLDSIKAIASTLLDQKVKWLDLTRDSTCGCFVTELLKSGMYELDVNQYITHSLHSSLVPVVVIFVQTYAKLSSSENRALAELDFYGTIYLSPIWNLLQLPYSNLNLLFLFYTNKLNSSFHVDRPRTWKSWV